MVAKVQYKPKPRPSSIINKTVPLTKFPRKQTNEVAGPPKPPVQGPPSKSEVFGPPKPPAGPPNPSWKEEAFAHKSINDLSMDLMRRARKPVQQINETKPLVKPERPAQMVNEVKELEPAKKTMKGRFGPIEVTSGPEGGADVGEYNRAAQQKRSDADNAYEQYFQGANEIIPDEESDIYYSNSIDLATDAMDLARTGASQEQISKIQSKYTKDTPEDRGKRILKNYGLPEDFVGPFPVGPTSPIGMSTLGKNGVQSTIDDGNKGRNNRLSVWITGPEYRRQVMATGTGMDPDEIDDNRIYNKMYEMENNGFMPYTPDKAAEFGYNAQNIASLPTVLAQTLGQARNLLTDYKAKINGKSFSGKDFDAKKREYFQRMADLSSDPSFYSDTPDDKHRTPLVANWEITLGDGTKETVRDGNMPVIIRTGPDGQIEQIPEDELYMYVDSEFDVLFPSAGNVYTFDNWDDYTNSVTRTHFDVAQPGEDVSTYGAFEDLQLDDGTTLTFDEARKVANDEAEFDYDIGPFKNMAKPSYKSDGFFKSEEHGGGLNIEDFLPNMVDMVLQSAPYFSPYTSIPLGASDTVIATGGIDPRSYDPKTGTYSAISDNIQKDEYTGNILASALMPLTEMGLGRIGGKAYKAPFKWMANRFGDKAWMPAAEWATGVAGEGFEEVPSNLVEDLQQNGFNALFANPKKDDEGNTLYDDSGHEIRDENTPLDQRIANFWSEAPEALTGGSALGLLFGLKDIPSTLVDTRDTYRQNKEDKEKGINFKIVPRKKKYEQDITEEEYYGGRRDD